MLNFLKRLLPPKQTRRQLWMDVLCMWLIAFGLCIAFDQAFRFHAPLWHMALSITVTLGVMWLCYGHLRWLLAGVGSAIVTVVLVCWMIFGWDNVWTHTWGFLDWWVQLFPRDSIYNLPFSIILVQTLIHIGLALVAWLYIRVVRSGMALVLSSALFLCVLYFRGFPKLFWPLVLLMLGVFPLFARNYYDKGRSGGRHAVNELFSRNRLQIFIVALCFLVSLGLLLAIPSNTDDWIIGDLYVGFHDMLDAMGLQVPEESEYSFDTMQTMGLARSEAQLGGNLKQQEKTVLMTVETPYMTPLAGRYYDVYTGTGWKSDNLVSYKFNSRASAQRKKDVLLTELPLPQYCFNLDPYLEQVTFTVHNNGTTSTMYTAGRVTAARLPELPRVNVMFNDRGEIYANQIPSDYEYTFTADLRCLRSSEAFARDMNGLVRRVRNDDDPSYTAACSRYLQLPATLPASVIDKAAEIIGDDCETAYQMCERLETYLRSHYTYTTKPGKVPDGVDFVEHFLSTGKGYCTYFATAMTVMARVAGIPSRLVVGYGLTPTDTDGFYEVYATNAHAWVECYFKGVGWISFDPTAGSDYLMIYDVESEPVLTFDDDFDISTEPGTQAIEVIDMTGFDEYHPEEEDPQWLLFLAMPNWTRAVWIGVMVLLLLYLVSLARLLYLRVCYMPRYATKRFRRRRLANFYYRDFLRQYRHLGFVPQGGETLPAFERRLDAAGQSDGDTRRLVTLLCDWKYGDAPITEEQVYFLGYMHGRLEERVRRKMNGFSYWFFRVFLSV